MKKCFVYLLISCLMLQSIYIVFADSAVDKPVLIYMARNFEEQQQGDTPYAFRYEAYGEYHIENVTGNGNTSAKCLGIGSNSTSDSTYGFLHIPLTYAPITKNFVFSTKVMTSDTKLKTLYIQTNATNPNSTNNLATNGVFELLRIADVIKAKGVTVAAATQMNQWYQMDFAFDMNKLELDVYLDGALVLQNVSLPADTLNIAGIRINIPDDNSKSIWYLDDMRLYMADAPMEETLFQANLQKYAGNDFTPKTSDEGGRLYRYDKFCFLMLYNKFVATQGGRRFYKNNQFYDLTVPIYQKNDAYMVPLKVFAESFGASVQWNAADESILISNGSKTLKCIAGKDIFFINGRVSKSKNPVEVIDGYACIQLDILTDFFNTKYNLSGDLLVFGDEPLTCEWNYGVMKTNAFGYTFEEEILRRIQHSLVFERPEASEVLTSFQSWNHTSAHPRLLIKPNTFDMLKANMLTDEKLARSINQYISKADLMLEQSLVEYTFPDGLQLSCPQLLYERGIALSFAYKMTGDTRYKDKLWENLLAASAFPNFNPKVMLNVGNSATGISIAYDWLYYDWTEQQRAVIREMIKTKVLDVFLNGYRTPYYYMEGVFADSKGNQPIIINNGGVQSAIALLDEYPELCSEIISHSLRSVETSFMEFAPDGAWVEGISYWQYTMMTLPYLISNYQTGLNSDFGLMNAPGLRKTAYFPIYMSGTEGSFNFGDATPGSPYDPSMQWFANQYQDMSLAILRNRNQGGLDLKDILYYIPGLDITQEVTLNKDSYFRLAETSTFRTGWSESDMVACLHGGENNAGHGHLDNGHFMLDAFGERWACDIPKEDYNLAGYGSYIYTPGMPINPIDYRHYYRIKAEGHNTIVANLNSTDFDQTIDAFSKVIRYSSQESGGYSILDMTPTNPLYNCALRGLKLDRIKQEAILQDNFTAKQATDFWWFMNTQAEITLANNNKTAILNMNGKYLWVSIISDGDATFQILPAQPLPQSANPPIQTSNIGYRKLAIHQANSSKFKVSVAFKQLLQGQSVPSILPQDSPMETWSFPSGNAPMATLSSVEINGENLAAFSPNTKNYTINVLTEKSDIPTITAKSDGDYNVEIVEAKSIPGITTVALTKKNGEQMGIYNFAISAINDSRKFLNDKQIPIVSYFASSEPESNNGVANLFDGLLDTKFSTDEQGGTVQIEFESITEVEEVKMAFINGAKRSEIFTIELSQDGKEWTEVYNGRSSGTTTNYQSFAFEAKPAKYLRAKFYGNDQNGAWVSVSELCAFRP